MMYWFNTHNISILQLSNMFTFQVHTLINNDITN